MGLGFVFYILDNPRKRGRTIPPDTIIPRNAPDEPSEALPVRECRQYVDAAPLHSVEELVCTGD